MAGDYQRNGNFAQFTIEVMDNNGNMILFMNDETHFHLNGCINKQNVCYWFPVNQQQLYKEPL